MPAYFSVFVAASMGYPECRMLPSNYILLRCAGKGEEKMTPKWDYVAIMEAHVRSITEYLAQNTVPILASGFIVRERYRVKQVIGISGMGQVYLTRDLGFKATLTQYALKEMMLPPADALDQQIRVHAFEDEANRFDSLNHPFIATIKNWFIEGNRAYLVMEYVEGLTLEDTLEGSEGFLNEQEVCLWALQLCELLTYLHTCEPPRILRDLKPSDVMLNVRNEIKLIDFGIGKVLWPKPRMIGHQGYSPPEQYLDVTDPRSDIYALGAMLHHLLTKSNPRMYPPFTFHERLPTRFNPGVSEEMEGIIMKCLEYEADKRYQSTSELGDALKHVLKQSS